MSFKKQRTPWSIKQVTAFYSAVFFAGQKTVSQGAPSCQLTTAVGQGVGQDGTNPPPTPTEWSALEQLAVWPQVIPQNLQQQLDLKAI